MNWILTIALTIVVVELVLRLPFGNLLGALRNFGTRGVRVVTAPNVSDHWKEKAMGAYARRTFVASLGIAALIGAILSLVIGMMLLFDRLQDGFQEFLLSWTGLAASLLVASTYVFIRRSSGRG